AASAAAAALPAAVLERAPVFLGCLPAAAAFADDVAHRLLDVDVLARLHRPDGEQRMPVVGRGNRDRVEVLVLQGLADVLHAGRLVAAFSDLLPAGLEQAGVGVDQVSNLHALQAKVLVDVGVPLSVDTG